MVGLPLEPTKKLGEEHYDSMVGQIRTWLFASYLAAEAVSTIGLMPSRKNNKLAEHARR